MTSPKKYLLFVVAVLVICAFLVLHGAAPEVKSIAFSRLTAGFLVGGALALSGSICQTIFRNELATPYTLGVSGGAALGAAAAICMFRETAFFAVPCGAFSGAALTFLLVLFFGRFGRTSAAELLLGGVIAGTVLSGILIYLVSTADRDELAGLSWWLLGDLSAVDPKGLILLGGASVAALTAARIFSADLNAMSFGDEGAALLGVSVMKVRLALLCAAALLASLAVACAGIIGFVGLIVPHIVRRIAGSDQRKLPLPVYFSGGLFLAFCDRAGRWIDPVRQLPAGVLTAIAGGTLFLFLLHRHGGKSE